MKISITLANYNHGRYLATYFAGIRGQTHQDWELLVTDDGSTDQSREIIRRHAAEDTRIKVFEFPENRGSLPAFYNSYGKATGELVYATASDDYLLDREFLAKAAAEFVRRPKLGAFFGVGEIRDADTGKLLGYGGRALRRGYISPERCVLGFLANELIIQSCAAVVRKACIDELGGFPAELGPSCDYYLNHAIAARFGAHYTRDVVTCARLDPRRGNLSMQVPLRQHLHNICEITKRFQASGALSSVPREALIAWLNFGVRGAVSAVYDCFGIFRHLRELHARNQDHASVYSRLIEVISIEERNIAAEACAEIKAFDKHIRSLVGDYHTDIPEPSYAALVAFVAGRPDLKKRISACIGRHKQAIQRYATIVVYGMGAHTTALLEVWRTKALPPITAVTSSDALGGGHFHGIPIVSLDSQNDAGTLVLLSSHTNEGLMFQATRQRAPHAAVLSFWDPRLTHLSQARVFAARPANAVPLNHQ